MREVRPDIDQLRASRCYHHLVRIADKTPASLQLSLALAPDMPRVRHSARARRVALRILTTGVVELVVPRGVGVSSAWRFYESRADWVREHVARRQALTPVAETFPPASIDLDAVGESWRVDVVAGLGRLRLIEQSDSVLTLHGTGTTTQIRQLLLRWLSRRALLVFERQLRDLAAQHEMTFSACHVRNQRTRWGSCSSRGVLSLNLSLLFQPPEVLRYLLCHELSHTRHMNHSRRFWECVAQMEPEYKMLDATLCQGWRRVPQWVRASHE
jgi:predicted metal-dependent hydrolase